MTGTSAPDSTPKSARTVSIVIPTYNNQLLLSECLASLRDLTYPPDSLEIIVVDNASAEETAGFLRSRFPTVKHIALGKNSGFAAACNGGASEASGEYVAFLNDDAIAEPGWIEGLFAGLDAGGEGAVCAASHIRSRDGREVEFSGASANIFGVGRPRSVWGWPDSLETPGEGSPLLFASGGAMLVHRRTFLDAGGFDPEFFAYFEDVDLGWRLWLLGHKVVYAPHAVVLHTGGATGSRAAAHRRYTLWECNSLATLVKNYEGEHMERILTAALILLYKRALLACGDTFNPADYELTAPPDTNTANVERLPKISVAHLAAMDRFNALLPHFMEERRRVQMRRVRSDAEILPLLGRAFEPQFAGRDYADAARGLAASLRLYDITHNGAPNRVLVLASPEEQPAAQTMSARLARETLVALAVLNAEVAGASELHPDGYAMHELRPDDPKLAGLLEQTDAILAFPTAASHQALAGYSKPLAVVGGPTGTPATNGASIAADDYGRLLAFCAEPGRM